MKYFLKVLIYELAGHPKSAKHREGRFVKQWFEGRDEIDEQFPRLHAVLLAFFAPPPPDGGGGARK